MDNLTFIINCNLQRRTGQCAVTDRLFRNSNRSSSAGWNVVKVLWGSEWDTLLLSIVTMFSGKRFAETPDGEYTISGRKTALHPQFFEKDPKTAAPVKAYDRLGN